MTKSFRVGARESGEKLIAFLSNRCGEAVSKKGLKRAIDTKRCQVNGRVVTISTTPLFRGDRVQIDLSESSVNGSIEILYEDEWILIINKSPGVICEKQTINQLFPDYQNCLELVHRLDKETSGALILAKSQESKKAFETLFKARKVTKVYHALADGEVNSLEGTIENRLAEVGIHQGQPLWGSTKDPEGREAITHWRCLKRFKGFCFLEVTLETGRTHQIRVHLSEMGCPILGDAHYGKRFVSKERPSRNMLHAYRVFFESPFLNHTVDVTAPLPADFLKYM